MIDSAVEYNQAKKAAAYTTHLSVENIDMPDNKTTNPASTSGTASSTGGGAAAAAAATSSAGAASSTATASPTGATAATSSNTAALEKMVLERDQDLIDCLVKGEQSRVDRRRG